MSDFLTPEEVAAELRSSVRFVHDELRRKNLRGSKLNGWRISRADLQTYIDSRANVRPVRKAS